MPRPVCVLIALLSAALVSCGNTSHSHAAPSARRQRVVLLMPSLVEDFCAIGGRPQLVGVPVYVEDVPCARGIPVVANFSSVDTEKIVSLQPDLVVGIPSQGRMLQTLRSTGIRVVTMRDDSFADLFSDVAELGRLTGRTNRANALIASLHARTRVLHARTKTFKRHPTVFVALGTGPIYTVGPSSFIARMIALAGGRNAVSRLPSSYAAYSAEALLRLQPDAIVTDPSVHLSSVLQREPWRNLHAVRNGRVFVVPTADIFERPGPRYVEGLQWLIDRLQPIAT